MIRIERALGLMTEHVDDRFRRVSAGVCLIAAFLLLVPSVGLAISLGAASCCTSEHCNIPAHHHPRKPMPMDGMDCSHDMGAMSACRLSCCNDEERQVTCATIFVLPFVPTAPVLPAAASALPQPALLAEGLLAPPLSPPPRILAAA